VSKQTIPVNDQIRARTVRVIGEQGEQHGIMLTSEALALAENAGLDLVLVSPDSDTPVARIMDYGKFKYLQKKQQHEHRKHQPQLKELRLRPKTEEHDLQVRIRQARGFLERGDRVLVVVMFRGREMAHVELGRANLARFFEAVQDLAKMEKEPTLEGRRMTMLLVKK